MKVALKAARVCIDSKDLIHATKVLERAAVYQETLNKESDIERDEDARVGMHLCVEYYAVRATLVSSIVIEVQLIFVRDTQTSLDHRNHKLTSSENRHGVKTVWTQQSICLQRASSSTVPFLPLPPKT